MPKLKENQPEIGTQVTARERIVLILIIFAIKMLKPWEYDHQFDKFWAEIKENFKSKQNEH